MAKRPLKRLKCTGDGIDEKGEGFQILGHIGADPLKKKRLPAVNQGDKRVARAPKGAAIKHSHMRWGERKHVDCQ